MVLSCRMGEFIVKLFDKIVVGFAVLLLVYSTVFAGVLIMSALMIAIGFVFSVAVLMHKFDWVRRLVIKYSRWVDLLAFAVSFVIAGTALGYIAAVFIGVLTSAFLSVYVRFQK